MNSDASINDEELREEFEKISEVFSNGSPEERFEATSSMLRLISRYLASNIKEVDVFPITSVLSDLATIEIGREPSFIKTHQEVKGKNPDPRMHMYYTCISAAVIILTRHGYDVGKAEEYVADLASLKKSQVHQIRSDLGSRGTSSQFKQYYVEQINLEFQTTDDAEKHIYALVTPILKILNK